MTKSQLSEQKFTQSMSQMSLLSIQPPENPPKSDLPTLKTGPRLESVRSQEVLLKREKTQPSKEL